VEQAAHSEIVSFSWGIVDNVLHDLFARDRCPHVIGLMSLPVEGGIEAFIPRKVLRYPTDAKIEKAAEWQLDGLLKIESVP